MTFVELCVHNHPIHRNELYHANVADRHSLSLATDGNRRTTRWHTHDSEAFCEERPD